MTHPKIKTFQSAVSLLKNHELLCKKAVILNFYEHKIFVKDEQLAKFKQS
jgi:hypothetical protein